MPRPRKEAESGESTSVPIRLHKYDLDWLDKEAEEKGYKSRADVLRDALKYYRWSRDERRSIEEDLTRILSDPEKADRLAGLVAETVFRKLKEKLP